MWEWMYRSTFSSPRHQVEGSGQLHAPVALLPGKELLIPTEEEAGWAPKPVWTTWRRGNSWPYWDSNSDSLVVQSVANRYTDYGIPAPNDNLIPNLASRMKVWETHVSVTYCELYLSYLLQWTRIIWKPVLHNALHRIPKCVPCSLLSFLSGLWIYVSR
jgi:hypothetical protein